MFCGVRIVRFVGDSGNFSIGRDKIEGDFVDRCGVLDGSHKYCFECSYPVVTMKRVAVFFCRRGVHRGGGGGMIFLWKFFE